MKELGLTTIAFTGQRYKIWKQITTEDNHRFDTATLLLLVKDTKFESKSQPRREAMPIIQDCFYWSKIQNLKANHNNPHSARLATSIAFTGQRYKIWKQITTDRTNIVYEIGLLLLVKDTKFESKSQLGLPDFFKHPDCFYWSKIQNLKANHNDGSQGQVMVEIAFTGQRYKIWKQITTFFVAGASGRSLLLLVKDTKFESKSQPCRAHLLKHGNCFYWSKIQNLKANHNNKWLQPALQQIAFTGQRYKIWKQITTMSSSRWAKQKLLLLVKDTKFESKSQLDKK